MSEIIKSQTFEEKLGDRIRESIGDLITDEDLSKVVAKGINQAFFEERVTLNSYGSVQNSKPPLVAVIITDLMAEQVNKSVKEWFQNNPEEVKKLMDKVIADGMTKALLEAFDSLFYSALHNLRNEVVNQINR